MGVMVYTTVRSRLPITRARAQQVVQATYAVVRKKEADVSLHFIGTKKMHRLNREYMGVDRPTDVLSFPTEDVASGDAGDVFLCVPYIQQQAAARKIRTSEETIRLIAHGTLHLLGYDHDTPAKEKKMFGLQERVVQRYQN